MSTWIDCPEEPPEPGCYWERWKNNPGQAVGVLFDVASQRLDDHANRLAVLETRLASYGKRLDRAEQARAEQQAATAGEPEPAPTEACEQCGQVPVVCHDCGAWSCSCERDMEPCPSCGTRRCTNCGAEI